MFEIKITENESGQRTDRFLRKYLKEYGLGDIYRLFRKNRVKLNGARVKENHMLKEGDLLQLFIEKPKAEHRSDPGLKLPLPESGKDLDIIYEDDNIIIADKPAGILTHPDKPGDTDTFIDRALRHIYSQKGAAYGSPTFSPALCNRLDRNTGGIIIVAKNYKTLRAVNHSIRERQIKRLYMCIAAGKTEKCGEVKGYLKKDSVSNIVTIGEAEGGDGKQIHTIYRTIGLSERIQELGKQFSLLEVDLVTGRSHQIRAHFEYLGHPVIGDIKYGDRMINEYFKTRYNLRHQFLHGYKIVFEDVHEDIRYLKGKSFESKMGNETAAIISSLFENRTPDIRKKV